MPPKRKKSVSQKQKQSQRQSVVVNIGKTTRRRRKTTGRGRLPPPSYQQNLFPPTIIQQQANLGGLENEITRLTSLIQARQPVNNLVTPLSSSVNVQQDPSMPGIKAEERRAGPTASNFQPPPSTSSENFQSAEDEALAFIRDFDLIKGGPEPLRGGLSEVSTISASSRLPGFDDDESIQDAKAEAFKKELEKQRKIPTDNPGVKPSPFTTRSTLAEEMDPFKITRDASDAEEKRAERQKLYSKAIDKLPRKEILEGGPDYNPKIVTNLKKKLGESFFRDLQEENRKLLAPKPKKAKPRADSSDSD